MKKLISVSFSESLFKIKDIILEKLPFLNPQKEFELQEWQEPKTSALNSTYQTHFKTEISKATSLPELLMILHKYHDGLGISETNLSHLKNLSEKDLQSFFELIDPLDIKTINISGNPHVTDDSIAHLEKNFPDLKILYIRNCHLLHYPLKASESLKVLDVSGCPNLSPKFLKNIFKLFPSLEILFLSESMAETVPASKKVVVLFH